MTHGPWGVLQAAITAVPAVKYALGIAGIGAVVAIIAGFQTDPRIAVFGIIIVIGLMFVLLVFARLTELAPKQLVTPALVATWSFLLLTIGVTVLLVAGYFFAWPRPLGIVVQTALPQTEPEPTVTIEGAPTAPLGKTTYYQITSRNAAWGEWSVGGFQNNQVFIVKPLGPSHRIYIEPTDPKQVRDIFVIEFTAYNKDGKSTTAEKRFMVVPAQ